MMIKEKKPHLYSCMVHGMRAEIKVEINKKKAVPANAVRWVVAPGANIEWAEDADGRLHFNAVDDAPQVQRAINFAINE